MSAVAIAVTLCLVAGSLMLVLAPQRAGANPVTQVFEYTGGVQTWTVPPNVTSIGIDAQGAQGGGEMGGFGGWAHGVFAVTPGQTLNVYVGQQGRRGLGSAFNGGGSAARSSYGGGGGSDVRIGGTNLSHRVIVAGGGGGSGDGASSLFGMGGSGGGLIGGSGGPAGGISVGGGGGGQTSGGTGNENGALGFGANTGCCASAGSGGGGYYGGGSGDEGNAGAGGGSNYAAPTATGVEHVRGTNLGNGKIVITTPPATVTPSGDAPVGYSFVETGTAQYFQVPDGVHSLGAQLFGGSAEGSLGGATQGVVDVEPGQIVSVFVGGEGLLDHGGYNGGGDSSFCDNCVGSGNGGGGASDIRVGANLLSDRVLVAGGAGAAAYNGGADGGSGGGAEGGDGGNGNHSTQPWPGGSGATQTEGGANAGGGFSQNGSVGRGGNGGFDSGGGGGGYFGGAGGAGDSFRGSPGGGGGGSGYVASGVTQGTTVSGVRSGDGAVELAIGTLPGNGLLEGGPIGEFEQLGGSNPAIPNSPSAVGCAGDPIHTGTGNFWRTWTDFAIPGRGVGLGLTRTYNSGDIRSGMFGWNWRSTYDMTLLGGSSTVLINQENGSQIRFDNVNGGWVPATPRINATLKFENNVFVLTRNQTEIFEFDSTGQLVAVADLNGYTTTIARPNPNSMIVTEPGGRTLSFVLGGGRVTSATDPAGRTTSYQYDANGDLVQTTDVSGGKWSFTYDNSHNMETMREPRFFGDTTTAPSPVVTNEYDDEGRVVGQTDQLGRTLTLDYTTVPGATVIQGADGNKCLDRYQDGLRTSNTKGYGSGNESTQVFTYDPVTMGMTSVEDPNGDVISMTYDARGNRLSTTNALNHTTSTEYNSLNLPTKITDAVGHVSNATYDAAGNLLTSSRVRTEPNPDAVDTTTYAYTAGAGDVTQVTDAGGHATQLTYNQWGDVASTTDATGNKTTYTYDTPVSVGRLKSTVAPKGNIAGATASQYTTIYDYDAFGRVTSEKLPLWTASVPNKNRIITTYDANGNTTSVVDGENRSTAFVHNAANELVTTTRPDGSTQKNTYRPDGSLHQQIDGKNNVTTYTYDSQRRLSVTTDALNRSTRYYYDAAGNLTGKADPGGNCATNTSCTTFGYDSGGRRTAVNYSDPATPDVSYAYDNNGRRTAMTDGTGTSLYVYDSAGRLTSTTDSAGNTLSYAYDAADRQTSVVHPGNKTVTRTYDDAGRITKVVDWLNKDTQFSYDPNSNLTTTDRWDPVIGTSTYDRNDHQTSQKWTQNGNFVQADFLNTRNGAGEVVTTTTNGFYSTLMPGHSYSYDQVARLSGFDGATTSYDSADNPTTQSGATQSFDAANQLASTNRRGGTSYQYDSRGNRTTATPLVGNTQQYSYDQANRLRSASSAAGSPDYQATVMADSPTGFWRMNDSSGSNVADSSGNNYTGNHSGPVQKGVDGALAGDTDKAFEFYNGDGQAWLPTVLANGNGDDTTVEFFMRWNGDKSRPQTAFAFGSNYSLTLNGGHFGFSTKQDGSDIHGVSSDLVAQKWVHVVGVFRNGNVANSKLYIDGALQSLNQRSGTPTASPQVAQWGAISGNGFGNNNLDGRIDEVSTYIGALPASRIAAHFNASKSFAATYTYDGDGLRKSKTVDGVTSNFVWDTSSGLPMLVSDGRYSFTYGPDGLPIQQVDSTNGNVGYFANDALGNTRMVSQFDGGVTARFDYDPFGNVIKAAGRTDTPLKFGGQYEDKESGLIYLRARYHDPNTNQFISRDPLEAMTRSAYGYADNDPVNLSDPSGLLARRLTDNSLTDFANDVDKARSIVKTVASGLWNKDVGNFDYGTTAAAIFNISYGGFKVVQGANAIRFGVAAIPVPGVGPIAGTAAIGYGAYNVASGSFRVARGGRQLVALAERGEHCAPIDSQSVRDNASRFVRGIAPNTDDVFSLLGGLP